MLYVNNKVVTYDTEKKELKKGDKNSTRVVYKDKYAEIIMSSMKEFIGTKRIEKPLVVQYPLELVTYSESTGGYKRAQFPASKVIPLIALVVNEDGHMEEWIYSETPLMIENGKVKVKEPIRDWNPASSIVITQKQFELAFFLKFKSPFCKDGVANEGGRYFFEFENKARTAKKAVENKQLRIKAENAIYVDLPEDKLRIIARSYHIGNEDAMVLDEVREAIALRALINDTSMMVFLKSAKINKDVKFKALVQNAIDTKVVIKSSIGRSPYWAFVDKDDLTKESAKICDVPVSQTMRAAEVLVDFLKDNEDLYKELEKRINS